MLVAIDGHSAAGKSTLAAAITESIPSVLVIHTDDFYRPMTITEREALDGKGGYESYYDWQRLKQQVLEPLSRGKATRYQKYDWQTNRLNEEWHEVESEGIIVVEGCYSMRPELRDCFDVMLFVESSAKERWQRQLARDDSPEEWFNRWDAAERYYMKTYSPKESADIVVAGE